MKAITSEEKLFKMLKKHSLVYNIDRWELNDYHKTPVGKKISEKFHSMNIFENSVNVSWFQKGFKLKHEFRQYTTFKELKKNHPCK